jgi:hypothetical protein
MICTNQTSTTASVIRLPDATEERKEMGLLRYLSQFPKAEQKKVFNDLVAQDRVFTRLTDNGLVGFVRL